ncbi:MAG TPA: SDR family oxidoreductase [Thermohalobaculum sp.]|nr:SDR family oxidoreductase [Thermohalobaculum sp.]
MPKLDGKSAIVTGAGRGIGACTARALAREGASVLALARSTGEIEAVAGEIGDAGGRAVARTCDVSRYEDVAAAVAACREAFGRVDILVNNAGVIEPIGPLAEADPEAWGRGVDINLTGVFHGLRAVLPEMIGQGSGVVVNLSSGAATHALEGWSQYCAAKAGAAMLTRAAQAELGGTGVRVVGLSPGTVATAMQEAIRDSGINPVSRLDWSEHIPPEWPAEAIVWLAAGAAAEHAGTDVSLRDPEIRRRVGLPGA